jgi:hypothetical protein
MTLFIEKNATFQYLHASVVSCPTCTKSLGRFLIYDIYAGNVNNNLFARACSNFHQLPTHDCLNLTFKEDQVSGNLESVRSQLNIYIYTGSQIKNLKSLCYSKCRSFIFDFLVQSWSCGTDNCNDNSFYEQINSNTCYDLNFAVTGTKSLQRTY